MNLLVILVHKHVKSRISFAFDEVHGDIELRISEPIEKVTYDQLLKVF